MEYANDRPLKAMLLLVIAIVTLSLQDALIKNISAQLSFWQIQCLRSLGNGVFLIILIILQKHHLRGLYDLWPKNPVPVLIRSAFIVVCMACLFAAAPSLSFAQMASGLYLYPLFVTLLAGPVLAEKIGIWRISALIVGAMGALIMLNPWQEAFQYLQLLPMIAGFSYACNVIMLRRYCREESPICMAFMIAIALFLSGFCGLVVLSIFPPSSEMQHFLPFITKGWQPLGMFLALMIILLSILNTSGNILAVSAYQQAESSRLAPIDFCYLPMALLWGMVIHNDYPTSMTLLGMVLIAGSGILTAIREHIRKSGKIIPKSAF